MRVGALIVLAAALSACGGPAAPPPATSAAPTAEPALFAFHSAAWTNLHHVLYLEGLRHADHPDAKHDSGIGPLDTRTLSPDERAAWDGAVAYYATAISPRNLTFDGELETIDTALATAEGSADLGKAALPPELASRLAAAMPAYRTHWWAEHDRANRSWIAALEPHLARSGRAIAAELALAYDVRWPTETVRVDVSAYACWEGAYTTLNPVHVTASSLDRGNLGPAALEIVFHEVSHLTILPLKRALADELAAQKKASRDLWHVLLFFSVGEIVKKHLGEDYVTYADKEGLYERVPNWGSYRTILRQHWAPHLDGRTTASQALRELVRAL